MAENQKENNLSEVEGIEAEYNEVKGGVENQSESRYFHNVRENELKGENRGSVVNINAILQNAENDIFSAFASENAGINATNKNELSEEDRAKYEDFLKSEQVGQIYENADNEIKKINKNRNFNLKRVGKNIDQLRIAVDEKLEEVNGKISDIEKQAKEELENLKTKKQSEIDQKQAEIESLDKKDKNYSEMLSKLQGEKAKLEGEFSQLGVDLENNSEYKKLLDSNKDYKKLAEDKGKLEKIRADIGPSKEELSERAQNENKSEKELDSGLSKDLRNSLSNQKELRQKAQDKAKEIFGEDRVKDDFGITTLDKDKEQPEENKEQQGDQQVNQQTKNGNVNPVMAGASPKQQGAAGFVPQQGGVSQGIPGEGVEQGEPAEKPEPSGMSYLSDLGYTGEVLKAGTSISLLKSFVDADQKTQLAILKDNEAQKVVFEAMKKANNRWTPLSAIKFNKTRRALIDMANGPMMRKALETIGKDVDYTNLDSLDDKFKGALKEYQENRDQKQKEIDSLPDGEEKSKLQAELDAFDKEYSAITGVSEFRNISNNELNRFRDRVVDKMSNVFNRNQYDKISAPSKKQVANEKGEDLKNRTTRIVSDDRNRYIENLQNNTVSIKDQAKNAAARGNKNIDRNINEQVVDDQVIDEQDLNR